MSEAADEADVLSLSVKQRFREALAEFAENHPDMSVPECARAFVGGLMDDDLDLIREMLVQDAQAIVATLMRREITATRHSVMVGLDLKGTHSAPIIAGGRPITRVNESLYERIESWREFAPNLGRHSNILEMTRVDLTSSADYDQQRADKYALKMLFKRELARDLDNDEQTVGSKYTTEQIYNRLADVRHRLNTGALRLKFTNADRISLNPKRK